MNKISTLNLDQRNIQRIVLDQHLKYATPVIWHDRNERWPKKVDGATCFFLRFQHDIVGVTANHVISEFELAEARNRKLICQLRTSAIFDLSSSIISRSDRRDLATFKVSRALLDSIGIEAIDCRADWPPPDIQQGDLLSFCGFPKTERRIVGPGHLEFRAYGALLDIDCLSEKVILAKYDPQEVQSASWAASKPPLGFNMSGCSGGPALMHRDCKGLARWFPVALITDGPRLESKEGEMLKFDIIKLQRINYIQDDGTIVDSEDGGWLPG